MSRLTSAYHCPGLPGLPCGMALRNAQALCARCADLEQAMGLATLWPGGLTQ